MPAPKGPATCDPAPSPPTWTCGLSPEVPSCHNEVVIRTASPRTLYPGDTDADAASRENYTKWYCNNQIPFALAYMPGSNPTANFWDASRVPPGSTKNYGDYIKAYQKQFEDICGPEFVPELVIFDYALAGGAPFKPVA